MLHTHAVAPLIHGFASGGFRYPGSTEVWKLVILHLAYRQKVSIRQILRHSAYVIHLTSSHFVDILSTHIFVRRVSIAQSDTLRETMFT